MGYALFALHDSEIRRRVVLFKDVGWKDGEVGRGGYVGRRYATCRQRNVIVSTASFCVVYFLTGQGLGFILVKILEAGVFAFKPQSHISHSTITMLGNDNFGKYSGR